MKLNKLNIMLRLYESNFRNLHWNSKGIDFDDSHKAITAEYYEMLGDTIDETAEMICRLGQNPFNYLEASDFLNNDSENKYFVVDTKVLYTREQVVEYSDVMLGDIVNCIEEVLAEEDINKPENIGIKSDLEAMHSKYDLQYRYINKRRMVK